MGYASLAGDCLNTGIGECVEKTMVIYKYQVKPGDIGEFSVAMPRTSTVVAVQMQGDDPQMWVIVDPGSPVMMRRFRVVALPGESLLDPTWRYIGTFQMRGGGKSAFHLLEEAIESPEEAIA